MDTHDTETRLANLLRRERDERNWSLAELAARSGVSKAAISKIERGVASPTASVLLRLATALDLTLAGLLLRAEDRPRLQRVGSAPDWRDPETGYRRRQIFSHPAHPVEIVEVALPGGAEITLPAASYARIRQVVTLLEGRLRIREGGELHELAPGDSLGFGPPSEVQFHNPDAAPCRYHVCLARS